MDQISVFLGIESDRRASKSVDDQFASNYFMMLNALHRAQESGDSVSTLVLEAAQKRNFIQKHCELLQSAVEDNYALAKKFGAFSLAGDNLLRLESGRAPEISEGSFAGRDLVVGYQVSPVVAPELRYQIANISLMPDGGPAMIPAGLDTPAYNMLGRFQSAGLLSKSRRDELAELYLKAQ
ncbi:MAG: hypothetical protein R3F11_05850 [Verrucomicrobiales bacterium]